MATGLIASRDRFADQLGSDLGKEIDQALHLAAQGSAVRDVNPGYTNIALMSAFLMDYVGVTQSDSALAAAGMNKARAIFELFQVHSTFPEFNSPTYYGVNLMALGMWRSMARSQELRDWGASMERTLWEEIGQLYHAGLRNMCGPYARSKGMDMSSTYTPILGLCIGMVLDDGDLAPMLSQTGLIVPEDVVPHLKGFQTDRVVDRQVFSRRGVVNVRAILKRDWMMGAVAGAAVRHEQFHPATIHWRSGDSVGWLLAFGESGASGTIEDQSMSLKVLRPDPAHPFRIQLLAPGVEVDAVRDDRWKLPGVTILVNAPLGSPRVSWVDDRRKGRVVEASWGVPEGWSAEDVAVQLTIEETD
ncbi:TPA: hypothetical protein DCE37_09890 [Candidatus Latescibacteria bacterium]|nr:hypothetical protein [Candidatus Latescibacterota bacterium]